MQADFDISQPSIEGLFVRQNHLRKCNELGKSESCVVPSKGKKKTDRNRDVIPFSKVYMYIYLLTIDPIDSIEILIHRSNGDKLLISFDQVAGSTTSIRIRFLLFIGSTDLSPYERTLHRRAPRSKTFYFVCVYLCIWLGLCWFSIMHDDRLMMKLKPD